ncbi:MAG: NAD(P)/FAD-dependent oxidoreductase [Planctomycetota bacterium]|jgi:flavin-dependent dehydrogenase
MTAASDTCDVLIVGGGPAGSTCAWRLRQLGLDVQILDRATFPRDKVCAGWITPHTVDALQLDLDDYSNNHVLQPVTSFRVSVLSDDGRERRSPQRDRSVLINYGQPVSYAIRRVEFDEYLLRRSGVTVREGIDLRSIDHDGDGWIVNDRVRAGVLVGAGGHFCPVARYLHARSKHDLTDHVVAAQEAEYRLSEAELSHGGIAPETPELFFYPDLLGYAWCVRKGDWLNVGLGRDGEHRLSRWRDDFVSDLVATGRLSQPPIVPFRGHAYRLNTSPQHIVASEGVFLIGDSAGLADRHSGEGIRPAVESALIAAQLIARSDQQTTAAEYADVLRDRFCTADGGIADLLPETLRNWLARHLLRRPKFVRDVVLDRWFLNRHQPHLSDSFGAADRSTRT